MSKQNVNQYAILHMTSIASFGSHMPLATPFSSSTAFVARSIGTSSMMLAGRAIARNTGTRRYAGVDRSGM